MLVSPGSTVISRWWIEYWGFDLLYGHTRTSFLDCPMSLETGDKPMQDRNLNRKEYDTSQIEHTLFRQITSERKLQTKLSVPLTCSQLKPRADFVDCSRTAKSKKTQTEETGPNCPQGHAHQHCHRLERGEWRQRGQSTSTVQDRPIWLNAHLREQGHCYR